MNLPKPAAPQAKSGINLQDILYVLFKHKWKIILLTLLGLGIAGGLFYRHRLSPTYQTDAKLLVRYVVERSAADPEAPVQGGKGGAVMDAELQILKSFDVALDTAAEVGPEKILPDFEGTPTTTQAAAKIYNSLEAKFERGSNVIALTYRESEPALAVEVLRQYIQSYFARHLEIHRSTGAFDQVRSQTDQARSALRTTENEINRLKAESGVISIEGTIAEFESRRQVVRGSLLAAQAALAEQRAKVAALGGAAAGAGDDGESTADGGAGAPADEAVAATAARERRERAEAMAEYRDLAARLNLLRQERNQLLIRRPPTDPVVVALNRQISEVQKREVDLVLGFPELAGQAQQAQPGQPGQPLRAITLEDERALEAALLARINVISEQYKAIESEVEGLSDLGFRLEALERRRQMEDEKYRYYQTSLEKAEVDEALDPTKIPNISIVQNPSTPVRSLDQKTLNIIMGVAASGLVLGILIAFLIEFVIDRKVSRPIEIHTRLQLPLMMSIPYIRSDDDIGKLLGPEPRLALLGGVEQGDPPPLPAANRRQSSAQRGEHFIAPYVSAIHDRILFNFEVNNITHKPKLVGLTGLSTGAGASTIAAGLAKAFSDHHQCKVLLVDLNPPASLKLNGDPASSLRKALEQSQKSRFRESPQNLYFASAATRRNGNGDHALAPAALHQMMPQLVGSNYDYIVFDLPPVNSTSPTLAMAGFLDKVLLVLDADKTTRENLSWAYSELVKTRADVSCIFNKARSHAPRWVEGEV